MEDVGSGQTPSTPSAVPRFALENQTPFSYSISAARNPNWGFTYNSVTDPSYPTGLRDDYWDIKTKLYGTYVHPQGYKPPRTDIGLTERYFMPEITRVPELIYPDTGIYASTPYQVPAPLYVNAMADKNRGIPNNVAPRLKEKKRVIRMNTPAEKAAYLASQAERGFTLVGDPYTPVTDTRLAPTTMLSTERIPFYGDYRAGQAAAAGRPFMTAGQAMRYVPHYLNDPRTLEALSLNAGRAVQGLAIGVTPIDALNRREANFTDFYERTGRDPSTLENYGLRIQSGLEPALNLATFGMYDYLADTPTFKKFKEEEERSRGARKERQEGIDKPYIGTKRFERTTK